MKSPEQILGERIRVAREARGLSQAQLGELTHSNQRVISKIESGKTDLKMSTLRRIAKALEVAVDWLTKEEPVGVELFGATPPKAQSPGARAKKHKVPAG